MLCIRNINYLYVFNICENYNWIVKCNMLVFVIIYFKLKSNVFLIGVM